MSVQVVIRRTIIVTFWLLFLLACFYLPALWNYALPEQETLHIFAFTDSIPREIIHDFEDRYNIKVLLNYFQSNEDLFAKLQISNGEGYDLIVCSDYMVELCRKANLLRPINKSLIGNYDEIDERIMGKYYDPDNSYSLPLAWTFYGIGINKTFFENRTFDATWDIVFKKSDHMVAMPDDAREVLFLSALYLFNRTDNLQDFELDKITSLLINQREWVLSYGADKADYLLLANISPIAVCQASYIRKIMRETDQVDFILPEQGSLLIIENLIIPRGATQTDNVHVFIDYLLSREVSAHNSLYYGYNPVNKHAYDFLPKTLRDNPSFFPNDDMLKKMNILSNDIPLAKLQDIWLSVKTA